MQQLNTRLILGIVIVVLLVIGGIVALFSLQSEIPSVDDVSQETMEQETTDPTEALTEGTTIEDIETDLQALEEELVLPDLEDEIQQIEEELDQL